MKWYAIFMVSYVHSNLLSYFICEDGTNIEIKQACDGRKDCPDASDETINLCHHILCPINMFRCYYGACVDRNAVCDGTYQCSDKSDERRCNKNQINHCGEDNFQCLSNECISKTQLCDGNKDCVDTSDESTATCKEYFCPENTYHCKYGGCIPLQARCDNIQDCIDASDESKLLCENLKCVEKQCRETTVLCPPIINSRISVKCTAPQNGLVSCNDPLPVGTIARYQCEPYFNPIDDKHAQNTHSICQHDGTWNRPILKCEPECGRSAPSATPLIVNGWVTEHGRWPWHVVFYNLVNGEWQFFCGGSLISEKAIISAGHCFWKTKPDVIKAALAKYQREFKKQGDFTQIMDIEKIILHPLYQDIVGNFGSDISIVVLKDTVQFSHYVSPVCIDWNLHDIGEHLSGSALGVVVGLGLTENDTFSNNMRATFLPTVPDTTCIESHTKDFKKYVTYTSFCAGWLNGTGVCNGDSGGGLVFRRSGNQSEWVLQGVVSISPRRLGTSYCDTGYYTIFTKVGMYVEWIKDALNQIHFNASNDYTNIIF